MDVGRKEGLERLVLCLFALWRLRYNSEPLGLPYTGQYALMDLGFTVTQLILHCVRTCLSKRVKSHAVKRPPGDVMSSHCCASTHTAVCMGRRHLIHKMLSHLMLCPARHISVRPYLSASMTERTKPLRMIWLKHKPLHWPWIDGLPEQEKVTGQRGSHMIQNGYRSQPIRYI